MVDYKCLRCGFSSIHKNNFKKHLLRKKICKPILSCVSIMHICKVNNIILDTLNISGITDSHEILTNCKYNVNTKSIDCKYSIGKNIICEDCNTVFNSRQSKYLHKKKYCKINKSRDYNELKKNNDELQKNVDELKKLVEKILIDQTKKLNKITNNKNSNNNNTTNSHNKIIVNNFGSENLNYITNNVIKKMLDKPCQAIPLMIKEVHFNKNHPENHNIKITNYQRPYGKRKENGKWNLVKKQTLLNDITDNTQTIFEEYKDNNELDNKSTSLYNKFDTYFDNNKDAIIKNSELVIINESTESIKK